MAKMHKVSTVHLIGEYFRAQQEMDNYHRRGGGPASEFDELNTTLNDALENLVSEVPRPWEIAPHDITPETMTIIGILHCAGRWQYDDEPARTY